MKKAKKQLDGRHANRKRSKPTNAFARWLDATGERVAEVAAKLEISTQHAYNLRGGHNRPSIDLAARIEKMSGGAVSAVSWGSK